MGKILVHEFMALDGVIEDPKWTMDYPFVPKMGEAIGEVMGSCKALLLDAARSRCSRRRGRPGPPRTIPAPRS